MSEKKKEKITLAQQETTIFIVVISLKRVSRTNWLEMNENFDLSQETTTSMYNKVSGTMIFALQIVLGNTLRLTCSNLIHSVFSFFFRGNLY